MKALQGFLIFMGALAVLACIALIIGYVLALLTPDIRSNMRPVVLSSEAVDSLNNKIADLKKEAAVPASGNAKNTLQIVITEEEVNSLIVMTLAEGNLPIKEMLVNFNDGYLLGYDAWNFPGIPVKTGVMGSIDVENGKPRFLVRDFFLGKLPVPDAVVKGAENLVNILIKVNSPMEEMNQLKLDLQEITIMEGQLKIVWTRRAGK